MMRNIGILAHVDAGKTTVTEKMLTVSGCIKAGGSVDDGTAHTDTMTVEKQRGISVKAASVSFSWKDTAITLVDTPGHADFASEVERSIWAIDGAVVVVSAVEGVQAQTEIVFSALQSAHIPVIFFINKTDRIGADRERVLSEIAELPNVTPVPLWDGERLTETVCETDDDLLEAYLDGNTPSFDQIKAALQKATAENVLYPVLSGAALKNEGIEELLDAVVDYLPAPKQSASDELCGVVFAVRHERTMGRAAVVRLFSGSM